MKLFKGIFVLITVFVLASGCADTDKKSRSAGGPGGGGGAGSGSSGGVGSGGGDSLFNIEKGTSQKELNELSILGVWELPEVPDTLFARVYTSTELDKQQDIYRRIEEGIACGSESTDSCDEDGMYKSIIDFESAIQASAFIRMQIKADEFTISKKCVLESGESVVVQARSRIQLNEAQKTISSFPDTDAYDYQAIGDHFCGIDLRTDENQTVPYEISAKGLVMDPETPDAFRLTKIAD